MKISSFYSLRLLSKKKKRKKKDYWQTKAFLFQVEIEAIYEEVNIASLLNGLDELVEGPLVDTSLVVGTTPTPQSEKTRW